LLTVNLKSLSGVEEIVDVCVVIRQRLEELGLEQKALAAAAEVTESYISQLLARKKLPPAPDRTDIYDKMAKFLKLPSDRLPKLAELQRREELKKDLVGPPSPMFREVREVILRKCVPDKEKQVREIFERQPFGELEHFITQKLLDVIKKVANEELNNKAGYACWLDSWAEAMSKRGLPSWNSWTRISSAYRLKTAHPFWIR
jgi:transcriptional regulator with XRE-family HTH domain